MYQTPDKPHAHGKRPCRGLEKCCFCPVWKPPRRPGSPAAVPLPRLPGTAGGSGRLSESDAWVTTSRWPPFNGQRRHLSSLPPSSFSLLLFFFFWRGRRRENGERGSSCMKSRLQTHVAVTQGGQTPTPWPSEDFPHYPGPNSWDEIHVDQSPNPKTSNEAPG